jgi:hypothetical protein
MEINREHPEYTAWKAVWPRYRDLYTGGEQFISHAERYLTARHKEPLETYSERVGRAFYENYIGSIIDWYATTLFRREPVLTFESRDERARGFFNELAEDCDRHGSSVSDFFRRLLTEALTVGRGYVLLDFPKAPRRAGNRAEEEALGVSRGYFCPYTAEQVTNWQRDGYGEYEWVVVRTERLVEETGIVRRYARYDREKYAIYRQEEQAGRMLPAVLEEEGRHALARIGKVPLFEFTLGDGMWLMNKAAAVQLEHFNKSNALAYALTTGLLAVPVVYSDSNVKQTLGDSYYLQLGKDDRFGWTEPEGKVFEVALKNIDRLKEEIYRICYTLNQAGGALSKSAELTGYSKQRDYLVTQEVLRGFGDRVKDMLKRLMRTMAEAREDEIEIGVTGLDEFDIGEFTTELADAERLLKLGIGSATLGAEVRKKVALKYLCDASQETKDRVAREIDAAG